MVVVRPAAFTVAPLTGLKSESTTVPVTIEVRAPVSPPQPQRLSATTNETNGNEIFILMYVRRVSNPCVSYAQDLKKVERERKIESRGLICAGA